MKIAYVCEWGNNKVLQWSGTTYSLFKSLAKYKNVEDIDMSLSKIEVILLALLDIRFVNGKVRSNYRFLKRTLKYLQLKLNKSLAHFENNPKLIIGDYGSSNNSYYYMDLSIDSLIDIRAKNPDLNEYMNFKNVPMKTLVERRAFQDKIFRNANCIFTMGKWLEEHLVNYSGFDKEKVFHVGGGINLDITDINPCKKNNNKILFVGRDFIRKGGGIWS